MTMAITTGSAQDAETIAKLQEQLTRTERAYNESLGHLRNARERHATDILTIGQKLIEEANDRDWCEEYDTIVEELNGDLHITLPVREREFTVEVSVVLTITVSAQDADSAESSARLIAGDVEEACDNFDGVISAFGNYEVVED
jgi:uncharacterized protein YdiU (UPF0061 family)